MYKDLSAMVAMHEGPLPELYKNVGGSVMSLVGSILGGGAISQLAGNAMSLKDMFNKMTDQQMKKATENMPFEVPEKLAKIFEILGYEANSSGETLH